MSVVVVQYFIWHAVPGISVNVEDQGWTFSGCGDLSLWEWGLLAVEVTIAIRGRCRIRGQRKPLVLMGGHLASEGHDDTVSWGFGVHHQPDHSVGMAMSMKVVPSCAVNCFLLIFK